MGYTDDELDEIFEKTGGTCNLCGSRLVRSHYNERGARGAWHVDHSMPKSRGGTDYLRNLNPTHIDCNLDKSDMTTQEYRRSQQKESSSDCFIATAAYGSTLAPQLDTLRQFRDSFMIPSSFGSSLVALYSWFSPVVAKSISRHELMRSLVRSLIQPIVYLLKSAKIVV